MQKNNKKRNTSSEIVLNNPNPTTLMKKKFDVNEELTRWFFCICSSILVYVGIALLTTTLYHPDTDTIIKSSLEQCIVSDFQPEPVEAL